MSLSVINDAQSASDANLLISSSIISLDRIDPVNKTGAFTVGSGFDVYIVNGSGVTADVAVTLPPAPLNVGRILHFKNQNATYNIVSAAADVCLRNSATPAAAGTAFVANVNGHSATLISNGVYWYSMRHANF